MQEEIKLEISPNECTFFFKLCKTHYKDDEEMKNPLTPNTLLVLYNIDKQYIKNYNFFKVDRENENVLD